MGLKTLDKKYRKIFVIKTTLRNSNVGRRHVLRHGPRSQPA